MRANPQAVHTAKNIITAHRTANRRQAAHHTASHQLPVAHRTASRQLPAVHRTASRQLPAVRHIVSRRIQEAITAVRIHPEIHMLHMTRVTKMYTRMVTMMMTYITEMTITQMA